MGTPVVRELVAGSNYTSTTSSVTITTGSGTAVGDWLVVFHGIDYAFSAGDLPTPTGTTGTWTARTTPTQGGGNTTGAHLVVWTRAVTVGGAQSVTLGINGSDSGVHGHVYVLTNLAASPFVAAASVLAPASATACDAPSVTSSAGDLLLCGWQTNYPQSTAVTIPGSMSNGTNSPTADAAVLTTAREVAAGGATGTRTATQPSAANYSAASITIAGAAVAAAAVARPVVVNRSAIQAASW